MNDFATDDEFQRVKRNRFILPWYATFAIATVVDRSREFQKLGIDTVLINHKTRRVTNVEEKIVRWPASGEAYDAFALETKSCTVPGHESPGWMVYGAACRLLYCFEQKAGWLDCYWIDFKQLKTWFWQRHKKFSVFKMTEQNQTSGRVVPITDVLRFVTTNTFQLGRN